MRAVVGTPGVMLLCFGRLKGSQYDLEGWPESSGDLGRCPRRAVTWKREPETWLLTSNHEPVTALVRRVSAAPWPWLCPAHPVGSSLLICPTGTPARGWASHWIPPYPPASCFPAGASLGRLRCCVHVAGSTRCARVHLARSGTWTLDLNKGLLCPHGNLSLAWGCGRRAWGGRGLGASAREPAAGLCSGPKLSPSGNTTESLGGLLGWFSWVRRGSRQGARWWRSPRPLV